jgi:hypothetical protein
MIKQDAADLAQAQVAAALREQISRASEWANETFDGDPVSIADWLEAHIPSDAQAALDRVIAAAVAERDAIQETKPTEPDPSDTWHERRAMLPDGDPRKDDGK